MKDMLQYDSTYYESEKGLCMKAYQVKLSLKGMKPPIWRRMILPEGMNVKTLRTIIDEVMGWEGTQTGSFRLPKERQVIFTDEKECVDTYMTAGRHITYTYAAGDGWDHDLLIEEVLDAYTGEAPIVVKGKSKCPPETCPNNAAFMALKEANPTQWEPFWWNENLLGAVNTYLKQLMEKHAEEALSLEDVFLCLSDNETASLKRAIGAHGSYQVRRKDTFVTLLTVGAAISDGHTVSLAPGVAEAFAACSTPAFQAKRHRYCWLMQCIFVCHGLYGITPLDVLVKVFNRHKRFTVDQATIVEMLKQMPKALVHGAIQHHSLYYAPLLQDGNALSILHDRQGIPFYIPSAAEIEAGFFDGEIWYAATGAVRQIRRVLSLVFPKGKLSEIAVRQFLLGMMASYAVDSMINLVEKHAEISLSVVQCKAIEQVIQSCSVYVRNMHYSGQMASALYHSA